MKKTLTLLACLFCIILTQAQEHTIQVYQGNTMLYENAVGNINEIHFAGSPASAVFNALNGQTSIPITSIDSLVFAYYEEPLPTIGDTVYIAYSNDGIIVNNPLSASGVDVMNDGANVTVYSTHSGSYYHVSGNTADGSLTFYSTHAFHLILDGLNLTSTSRAAVNIASPVHTTVDLIGTSTLSDGAGGGHVVDEAGQLAAALRLDRHDEAPVALGDQRLLQHALIAGRGDDLLQDCPAFGGCGAHMAADIRQLRAGGVGNLVLVKNGGADLVLQKAVRPQREEHLVQHRRLRHIV